METAKQQRLLDAFEFIEKFSNICREQGLKTQDYSVKIDENSCFAAIYGIGTVTNHFFFDLFTKQEDDFKNWCKERLAEACSIKTEWQNRIDALKRELKRLESQEA